MTANLLANLDLHTVSGCRASGQDEAVFSQRKSNGRPFALSAMRLHKPVRKFERPLHKLIRMSVHLIVIVNTLLLRAIQECVNINDIRLQLVLVVPTRRNAVVPPALRLYDEQVKQWHDGYIVDWARVELEDLREPDRADVRGGYYSARGHYIDFHAATVGVPAGKTAH